MIPLNATDKTFPYISSIYKSLSITDYTISTTDICRDFVSTKTATSTSYRIFGDSCISTGNYQVVLDPEEWRNTFAYSTIVKQAKIFKLKSQLAIVVKSRACPVGGVSEAEQRALDSLREMVSESDFRKYLKHGFLMIRGASGDLYQVYRDRHHTKIWRDCKMVEEVCVRIKDSSVPLTDNVIAFKTAIEVSEESFKAMGNLFKVEGSDMYRVAA
jgi:hypothetical protein